MGIIGNGKISKTHTYTYIVKGQIVVNIWRNGIVTKWLMWDYSWKYTKNPNMKVLIKDVTINIL